MKETRAVRTQQTSMISVKLAGASWNWLEMNTSWGTYGEPLEKAAREAVMAAKGRKVGKGWTYAVELPDDQAESVWSILDAIAGNAETWSAEERGDDAYTFRVMRRDAERIKESLKAVGWTFVLRGYFTVSHAPGVSQ